MSGGVKIISSGSYSSVQDSGRFGYRDLGVPISGAMDLYSYELANMILGNKPNSAVIEFISSGGEVEFINRICFVITGADFNISFRSLKLALNRVYIANAGERLKLNSPENGNVCYLAVRGGFRSLKVLGSRSQLQHITKDGKLVRGVSVFCHESERIPISYSRVKPAFPLAKGNIINVFRGPEFDCLNTELLPTTLTLSFKCNRMAYLLEETATCSNKYSEILSSAVMPGTVQLTPSGQLIILMRDAQTTGGYPRVLQLSKDSINTLAQCRPNDQIMFSLRY